MATFNGSIKRRSNCYTSGKRDGMSSFKNCLAFLALWQKRLLAGGTHFSKIQWSQSKGAEITQHRKIILSTELLVLRLK
jgi:hypothetical protein